MKVCERDAQKFCLELWDDISIALIDPQTPQMPSRDDVRAAAGSGSLTRLALLADFYRYQKEDLGINADDSADKLRLIRAEASRLIAENSQGAVPESECVLSAPSSSFIDDGDAGFKKGKAGDRGSGNCGKRCCETLTGTQSHDKQSHRRSVFDTAGKRAKRISLAMLVRRGDGLSRRKHVHGDETVDCNAIQIASSPTTHREDDSIKWSKMCFAAQNRSYYVKMLKAFQTVKKVGYPMLTLNSEWSLSCYYKLAVAYTTDRPLEMAAACLPDLKEAVEMIRTERFHKLRQIKRENQMLLYGVLNCHINWVDHNHRQILLVPREPNALPPPIAGDLRCSRCLKNQTFRSSEVKGNPKNIDVEFDFERMTFGSSCCQAPMINVPLSTRSVHTCIFTEMKQMYTSCIHCKRTIFSEVLVDTEMLYSRCAACLNRCTAQTG